MPCLFEARGILKEEGLLKKYNDAAAWFYCRKRVFDEVNATGGDLDDFNTMTVPRFLTILMMENEQKKAGYLRYFSQKFSNLQLPGSASGFHCDGSAHHHYMHYPIYMFGATNSTTPLIRLIDNTPFRINEDAHRNFSKSMLLGAFGQTNSTIRSHFADGIPTAIARFPQNSITILHLLDHPMAKVKSIQ